MVKKVPLKPGSASSSRKGSQTSLKVDSELPSAAISISRLLVSYQKTPSLLKIIDAYLVFLMITGLTQLIYCLLTKQYPYNAFLASFCTSVGNFVLAGMLALTFTANLRIQANSENKEVLISKQRFTNLIN